MPFCYDLADAEKARAKLPGASEAEHKGKEVGHKATAYIDEIVSHRYSRSSIDLETS